MVRHAGSNTAQQTETTMTELQLLQIEADDAMQNLRDALRRGGADAIAEARGVCRELARLKAAAVRRAAARALAKTPA